MNCCPDCFNDPEIKGIIRGVSTAFGTCDYCGSTDQEIALTEDLFENFEPLVGLYEVDAVSGEYLCPQLHQDWDIFAEEALCHNILRDILTGTGYETLLSNKVRLKYTVSDSVVAWDDFANEIKNTNRFFITNNIIVREVVHKLLNYHTKTIKAGTKFYRGRICQTEDGYNEQDLRKPPSKIATPGRANPEGISYFYVANEEDTTIYEIGASIRDFVCIGEFELAEDITIVALRKVRNASPFIENMNLEEYIINKDILQQFDKALSTPLRSFDSIREYLPTQYLCEYIKSLGIEGVEYASAMHDGGTNYAFFDETKFRFVKAENKLVENINITIK